MHDNFYLFIILQLFCRIQLFFLVLAYFTKNSHNYFEFCRNRTQVILFYFSTLPKVVVFLVSLSENRLANTHIDTQEIMKVRLCFSLVLILIQYINCFGLEQDDLEIYDHKTSKWTTVSMTREYKLKLAIDGCCQTYECWNCMKSIKPKKISLFSSFQKTFCTCSEKGIPPSLTTQLEEVNAQLSINIGQITSAYLIQIGLLYLLVTYAWKIFLIFWLFGSIVHLLDLIHKLPIYNSPRLIAK